MYGQGYVGTSQDVNKIRRSEKLREEQKKKLEEQQQASKAKVESAGLKQFGKSTSETLETVFKNETVGLITRDEFIQKRNTLQERLAEELKRKQQEVEEAALKEKAGRRKEKARLAEKAKLSFLGDDEGDEQQGDGGGHDVEESAPKRARFGKLGKDPTVPTEFLPDRDRERAEEELREQLKKEWIAEQERIKAEPLAITYSYWDGQGHRRKITVKQGDSISTFLKAVREQLASEFRELRAVSVDNLMYIKEDVILPHHHTFYDLITSKARGKSGPLFDFDVRDDIRITNDATIEKTDSHAGKVVERHWYDKNKHIFPASRWEVYDPDKSYDSYTIYG